MLRLLRTVLLLAVAWSFALDVRADEALHVRVDRMVGAVRIGLQANVASDAQFMRRVYLHLSGRIPSSQATRAFLDDSSPDKRVRLIEQLLNGPHYARQLSEVFSVMLMERRKDSAEWLKFLRSSLEQNKPWHQLAAEIMAADGADAQTRGPEEFFLARSAEPHLMTREVARLFFGMDVQCAQCHDHPLIDDYLQKDYYGLYAFLGRTYLFQPDKKKPGVLAEKAEGDAKFKSVFTGDEGDTRPRLPGESEISEPELKAGEQYKVKPDKKNKKVRPIPTYSRRAQLSRLLATGNNAAFRRNIANRLWAHMMGRGLVHPPDLHHSDNPPAHPELLDLLASEFAAMEFDIRSFLRELALTQTYQRSVALPENLAKQSPTFESRLVELQSEQKRLEVSQSEAEQAREKIERELVAADKRLQEIALELANANLAVSEASKRLMPLAKAQTSARQKLDDKKFVAQAVTAASSETRAASELLGNDQTLTQVSSTLRRTADRLAGEISSASQSLVEQTRSVESATNTLTAARATASRVAADHSAARQRQATSEKQLAELRQRLSTTHVAIRVARRRILTVQASLNYAQCLENLRTAQAADDEILAKISPLQQAAQQAGDQLSGRERELQQALTAQATADKLLSETKQQLRDNPTVVSALADAHSKMQSARKFLPQDAELSEITATIQGISGRMSNELQSLKKVLPARELAAKNAVEPLDQLRADIDQSTSALAELEDQLQPLTAKAQQLSKRSAKIRQDLTQSYDELTRYLSEQFVIGTLEPLSPEQLAWSVLQATGMLDKQRASAAAAVDKKQPAKPGHTPTESQQADRARTIEVAVYEKLKKNVAVFVQLFGAGAGQPPYDFFATFEQALFFANGGEVRSWLSPGGGNLTDRLLRLEQPEQVAEELYLSILTRPPNEQDIADIKRYLAARQSDKKAAVQELAWALLTSSEFRFHH